MRLQPKVPFAVQVANQLRGQLRREYAEGGRLPSETALAAKMRVSRGTVRQALAILQHEGLISRRQGLGTFAHPHVPGIPARIDFAYEFTRIIRASGYDPDVKTLELRPETASAEVAAKLDIQPGAPLLRLRKLFLASKQPAYYVDEVLPTDLIQEAYDPSELDQPIWNFLERRCHRPAKYVLSELVPSLAEGKIAALLDVAPGSPMLKFIEVSYDGKGGPLMMADIYCRSPLIRYHALRWVTPIS